MARPLRFLLLLMAWFSLALPAMAAAKPDLVILVSIDAFRFDYLTRGKTPVIAALAGRGVLAPMRPSFPSETFPNHYTLVTGLRPDRHGIVANVMDDPVLGHFTAQSSADPRWWNGGEPLWVTAGNQGLKTATMFWPGADHPIHGRQADYWKPYDKNFLADDRVAQVLRWLDLPPDQRPSLVTLYFDIVDSQGHRYGPNSKEVNAALASTDASVGRLAEGLKARGLFDRTDLILVADHGMADISPDRLIYIDDVAGGAAAIRAVTLGASSGLSVAPGAPLQTLKRLLAPHDHMRCWNKADLPKVLHYGRNPRVPPVVCLADVGWYITTHERMAAATALNAGAHGYDPADPQMAALFVAEGPDFKAGRTLPAFDNVDVQPLVVRLLHLKTPKADGTARVFDRVLETH